LLSVSWDQLATAVIRRPWREVVGGRERGVVASVSGKKDKRFSVSGPRFTFNIVQLSNCNPFALQLVL